MGKSVTAFSVIKLILQTFIFFIDVTIGIRLLVQKEWIWGLLTLIWVALGYLTTLTAVTIGKFRIVDLKKKNSNSKRFTKRRTGDFMSCTKFFLLSLKVHAELVAAFFHSGPQIVTQLAIFWSGIYGHDFEVYESVGTAQWFFAILEILSPTLNFISLVLTGVKYNNEPGPTVRQLCHVLSVLFTALLRIFVYSVMFKLAPLISTCILAFLYCIAVLIYSLCGEKYESIVLAYYALYLPCGQNNRQGLKGGKLTFLAGPPELERSRINHEGIIARVLKYFCLQLAINILIAIPLITFSEIWLFVPGHEFKVSPIIESRLFVYCTGFTLTIITLICYGLYYIQCSAARQAARTWTGLTPARSPLVNRRTEEASSANVISETRTPVGTPTNRQAPQVQPGGGERPTSMYSGDNRGAYSPSAPRYAQDNRLSVGVLPPGNRKCENEDCVTCTWLIEGPYFYSSVTKKHYLFMTPVTCRDTEIIYLVTCNRCSSQYVGKTQNSLRDRHYGHRREIDTQSSLLGKHFGEVCGINSWRIQIIDKCQTNELKSREGYWMHELKTLTPVGLNVRDEGAPQRGGGDAYVHRI